MRWPDITVTATRPGLFNPGSAPLTADNAPRIGMLARRIAVSSSALEELVGDVEPRAASRSETTASYVAPQRSLVARIAASVRAQSICDLLTVLVRRSIALAISVPRSCNTYPPVACSFGSADTPPCGRSELRVNEGPVCHSDVFVSPRLGRPSTPFHGCQQRCDRDKAEPRLYGVSERLFRAGYRVSRHPPEFPRLTATVPR